MMTHQYDQPLSPELRIVPPFPDLQPPGDREPHHPFSQEEVATCLRGVVNHEAKALLLLVMAVEPQTSLSNRELHERMVAIQGPDPAWVQDKASPRHFIEKNLQPFVWTTTETRVDNGQPYPTYKVNNAGIRAAAFGASILDWSIAYGYSPRQILGGSQTRNDSNAQQTRMAILEALVTAPIQDGLTQDQILEYTGADAKHSLKALITQIKDAPHPIFKYLDPRQQDVIFDINEKVMLEPHSYAKDTIKHLRAQVRKRYDEDKKTTITLPELVATVKEFDDTLSTSEAREIVLSARASFLERRPQGKARISIHTEALAAMENLIKRIDAFYYGIPASDKLIKLTSELGREIINDPEKCAYLMQQARLHSHDTKSHGFNLSDHILDSLPDNPEDARSLEQIIRERVAADKNTNPISVKAALYRLLGYGAIAITNITPDASGRTKKAKVAYYISPSDDEMI